MPTIALDCPHCFRDNMTFDIEGARDVNIPEAVVSLVCFCRSCGRGIEALFDNGPSNSSFAHTLLQSIGSSKDFSKAGSAFKISPARAAPAVPDFVSDEVKRSFLQAERARQRGDLDAAGAMYRKSLDVATRQKMPDQRGAFAERLGAMHKAGMLTTAISDWARHVRLLGNEAAHDADEPTQQETEDLANLTRMTLIYLFEMPERVRLLSERALGNAS